MPTSDELDSQDMASLAGGHDAALNALMERHSSRVYQYLLRSLQHEHDAQDLAQETFVRVYQNCRKFDPSQKFTTWLYTIASNLVRDRYRWRARHPQVSLDAESDQSSSALKQTIPDPGFGPDQELQSAERAETVKKAIAQLPEEIRTPLILATYQGLSQAEIGAVLSCSVKAVETRIYRAKNQLRERLGRLFQSL